VILAEFLTYWFVASFAFFGLLGLIGWLGRLWDERGWKRAERRAKATLASQPIYMPLDPSEVQEMALYQAEATKWSELASTLNEIRTLPEALA
jgi:hypothetical protein